MKQYEHLGYDEYREAQVEKNKKKFNRHFVKAEVIKWIARHAKSKIKEVDGILCHGVRNGREMDLFAKYFDCDIVGTDISETIWEVPRGVCWDFHDVNPIWNESYNVVYSNSFDHSYDPDKALSAWTDAMTTDRSALYLEWTDKGHGVNEVNDLDAADCLQATLGEYVDLMKKYFRIVEVHHVGGGRNLVVGMKKY